MEFEESESQSSMVTEPTGIEEGEFGLDNVHSYLTDKCKRLFVFVNKYYSLQDNNPEASMSGDPEQLLKYKMQLVSCLSQRLRHVPQEFTRFPAHAELDLVASLKQEVQDLSTLVRRCENQLVEDKKELASLKEKVRDLENMYEERKKNPEVPHVHLLLPVQKKLALEFDKHRTLLHEMVEKLFRRDSDILADILQQLSSAYFDKESGDPYVTIEDNYHCLEMLLETDIITRHPHNLKKYRLTNLLQ